MMRKNVLYTVAAKALLTVLLLAFFATCVMCAVSSAFMVSAEVYTVSEDAARRAEFSRLAEYDARTFILAVFGYEDVDADVLFADRNVSLATVRTRDEELYSFDSGKSRGEVFAFYYGLTPVQGDLYTVYAADEEDFGAEGIYAVTLCLSERLTEADGYYWNGLALDLAHDFKYWIYPIFAAAAILCIACYVTLLCVSGKRWGKEELSTPSAIPIDLVIAVFAAVVLGALSILLYGRLGKLELTIGSIFLSVFGVLGFVGISMSLALRIKRGKWWRGTLTYMLVSLIAKGFGLLARAISKIPLIWKTALAVACVSLAESLALVLAVGGSDATVAVFIVSQLVISAVVLYVAFMLRKLKNAGRRLADGELDYKVGLDGLFGEFKEHGEDLNRIGDGINAALEERMRSERMKTELITNVSHDLKTPLTSIINYSDLICREECENDKIGEYAQVLHRQSVRMKHLIDDLVEASKLSSGSVEAELGECDAAVFLEQLEGEYSQRLAELSLRAVFSLPTEKVCVMADSRKLWRVFDNLMSNICKYAQPQTRVYISLERDRDVAVFTFKNVSREPLGVRGDELTERFVRGDASRNTEGNGLGLSIARDLCELQGGELCIDSDGDLFKAQVRLPVV